MHALDVSVRQLETLVVQKVLPATEELHSDVKNLLGFRATVLGWAAAISTIVTLVLTWALSWVKHS